jgi:hypothetical protein
MVLGFSQSKTEDVATLIARKDYSKAIEIIRAQLKTQRPDPRLRLQLSDVLLLAGKVPEAITILSPLADEFAKEGFAAKAISVLKRIQKLDPDRRDVDARLASLIQQKQREATRFIPPPPSTPEIGMEEIGLELPRAGAAPAPAAPGLELGMEAEEPSAPEPPAPATPAPAASPVFDRDLVSDDDLVPAEAPEGVPEAAGPAAEPDPMTETLFAEELLSLVEDAFKDMPLGAGETALPAPGLPDADAAGGTQIVVSPLFKDLSVDELVEVIHGLKLLTFERSDVILREGEPGDSMYMLAAGTVRAFVKKDGKQVPLGDLSEGDFFGEVSVLTGKPRTATVVATNHCELLELDRVTLDAITGRHPHVMDVLRRLAAQRAG